ncbi:hypothetical protein MMC13_000630 [Lambiella insularis]|nr:hypothetical protein [Lambiella insularis]
MDDSAVIFSGLNAAQHTAVTSPASVLQILAPPGSGKTKTLTSRVAYLLLHHDYKPWNTLCLTFTIKSAREMRERLTKLIGNHLSSKLVLGTFHSVCRRYLVTYGYLIGIRKGFGIADSSDTLSIISRITRRLKLNIDPKAARSRISRSKARGIGQAEFSNEVAKKRNVDEQEFGIVFEAYESHLATSNLLDYDDLLLRCADLLRLHPACISNVEVVLIDEFQDTNLVQFDLMRLFAASCNRITTVGDPDQSIYGWRSAEVKNLKKMQKVYPDTLVIHLEDNYRSSGAILLAALEVIQQDESRPAKPLLPTHCPGTVPVLRRLPSAAIEAAWIVSEIHRATALSGDQLMYADFAILLRSASLSRQIESAMGKAGIPYRMVGGQRFFDRVEIKILLDYLRVISQPDNSDALARIINVPSRRIGDVTIRALLEEAASRSSSLWSLIGDIVQGRVTPKTKVAKTAEQGLGSVINIVRTGRKKMLDAENPQLPEQLLHQVMNKLDFKDFLEKIHPEDHESRWANVEELVAQASDYSIGSLDSLAVDEDAIGDALPCIDGLEQASSNRAEEALAKFLANVALSTEIQKEDDVGDQNVPQQRVTISTIHAAKGLEWPAVFIPSAYEGSIPHSRAEDIDEERRLLYVAMTRAQALLYMSCPTKNSMREETTLSPFLAAKKVAAHLSGQAPSLRWNTIQDISRILRRTCPSENTLLEGMKKVMSLEDNLWPLTGEEGPEIVAARWSGANGSSTDFSIDRALKRRRTAASESDGTALGLGDGCVRASSSIDIKTTMPGFPTHSTASHGGGFVSATSQLQKIRDGDQCGSIDPTIKPMKRQSSGSHNLSSKNSKKADEGLRRYWSSSTDTNGPAKLNHPFMSHNETLLERVDDDALSSTIIGSVRNAGSSSISRKSTVSSSAVIPSHVEETSLRQPMSAIPQPLANHSLPSYGSAAKVTRVVADAYGKSKPYVFLSSSPPPVRDALEESRVETIRKVNDGGAPHSGNLTRGAAAQQNDLRPASTYHITSVAQVQARNQAPVKTLGVRRSMAGWSARGKHTLSKPRAEDGC